MRVVTAFHACRNFAPGDGGECRAWEETLTLSPRTNMYTNTYYYNYYYIVLQESHVSLRFGPPPLIERNRQLKTSQTHVIVKAKYSYSMSTVTS